MGDGGWQFVSGHKLTSTHKQKRHPKEPNRKYGGCLQGDFIKEEDPDPTDYGPNHLQALGNNCDLTLHCIWSQSTCFSLDRPLQ